MSNDSYITVDSNNQPTIYAGPDAIKYFDCVVLIASLNLYQRTGGRVIPTRGVNLKMMLKAASGYTHKQYKCSQKGADTALADLQQWLLAMRTALPIMSGR